MSIQGADLRLYDTKPNFPEDFYSFCSFLGSSLFVIGQEMPPAGGSEPKTDRSSEERPNLLRELGLSPEQIKQIRKRNIERRPIEQQARRRFRDARQNLDAAIYGEALNESEVKVLLEEFQLAQGEMAKIRTMNELSVRKILTPEQLIKFRELRRSFARTRENLPNRRRMRSERQRLRRLNHEQKQIPNN